MVIGYFKDLSLNKDTWCFEGKCSVCGTEFSQVPAVDFCPKCWAKIVNPAKIDDINGRPICENDIVSYKTSGGTIKSAKVKVYDVGWCLVKPKGKNETFIGLLKDAEEIKIIEGAVPLGDRIIGLETEALKK